MADQEKLTETVVAMLREVVRLEDILFVVENGSQAIVEGWVDATATTVEVQDGWVAVESQPWHCHLDLEAVNKIRFVDEPDVHDPSRQAFSMRLLKHDGQALLMIFFGKIYEDDVLNADKVRRFKDLQEKYGSAG